jgi:hypothetical protein
MPWCPDTYGVSSFQAPLAASVAPEEVAFLVIVSGAGVKHWHQSG